MIVSSKASIFIIEDDYHIRHLLETILEKNGFIVSGTSSAENALKKIINARPSLIILDIQLPGMNGLEFCKKIRSDPHTEGIPLIFLSSHSSDFYKITGLESGADDFITKPFNEGELISRIKAVLRRTHQLSSGSKNTIKDDVFTMDIDSHTLKAQNKEIELAPKEFTMMALFLKSDGKVLSRDMLSTQVWEHENLSTSRTIDVHIARLRKKLGRFGRHIKTIGKLGYRYSIQDE